MTLYLLTNKVLKIYTKSTGIWRCVDGPAAADIWKDNNAFLFRVKHYERSPPLFMSQKTSIFSNAAVKTLHFLNLITSLELP